MFSDFEKEMIDKHFNGDAGAFLKDVAKGRRKRLKWNDIIASVKTFPELELTTLQVIKFMLGYVPDEYLTLPQEAFIRLHVDQYRNKTISVQELLDRAEIHVKMIRNEDMLAYINQNYDRAIYQDYFDYLPQCAEQVRKRLTGFLGYEAQLEHSVFAEIVLRQAMLSDQVHFTEALNTMDMRAIVAIKYREVLLTDGRKAADASPLVAIDIIAQNGDDKKKNWTDLI